MIFFQLFNMTSNLAAMQYPWQLVDAKVTFLGVRRRSACVCSNTEELSKVTGGYLNSIDTFSILPVNSLFPSA